MLRRSPRLAAKNSAAAAVNQIEAVNKLRPAVSAVPRRSPRIAAKAPVNYSEEPAAELTAFRTALHAEFSKLASGADTRATIVAIGRLIQANADIYPWISYKEKKAIDAAAAVFKQDAIAYDTEFVTALSYMAM